MIGGIVGVEVRCDQSYRGVSSLANLLLAGCRVTAAGASTMASNRLIAPRSQLVGGGRSLPPAVTPARMVGLLVLRSDCVGTTRESWWSAHCQKSWSRHRRAEAAFRAREGVARGCCRSGKERVLDLASGSVVCALSPGAEPAVGYGRRRCREQAGHKSRPCRQRPTAETASRGLNRGQDPRNRTRDRPDALGDHSHRQIAPVAVTPFGYGGS
jgi:hypothetical protein